ncbi:hypothetical protein HMPREF0591_1428 [Mycobacterium parascrofulaceum ATCC BAA-614]|uniref:WXG100 family type VII secretion target n=2 Tax=Mycobacterium parascrofulaceum TaxID=240125 RepID=D5P5I4_9MYCO|nr:hypothetical protein HMPREF0591_1428 [Mycobacterium parascrofulaceum ATCC BAA-614]
MIYHPAGLADTTASMHSFAQELETIREQAQNLLASSRDYFSGPHGAESYAQAQQLINEGIQDGKDVIFRHGDVIDQASMAFQAADSTVGQGFQSI